MGGTPERHPELPGNTVSRVLPGPFALVSEDATDGGDVQHAIDGQQAHGYGPFPAGPGRTTTPETFTSLMTGLEERVFGRLPDATWIYPGHGNDTTLGAERPHLEEWRTRGW